MKSILIMNALFSIIHELFVLPQGYIHVSIYVLLWAITYLSIQSFLAMTCIVFYLTIIFTLKLCSRNKVLVMAMPIDDKWKTCYWHFPFINILDVSKCDEKKSIIKSQLTYHRTNKYVFILADMWCNFPWYQCLQM